MTRPPSDVPPTGGGPPGRVPPPLVVAAGLVLLQGLLTVIFGISEAFHISAGRVVMGATTAVFFVAYGVGLGFCAWGIRELRPWSRGPVLLAELLFLGLAWSLRGSSVTAVAIAVAVSAVVVLAGVLHPRSIEALNREEHRRDR